MAARLASLLDAPVVHMDDIYPGWDGLAAAAPLLREWVLEPLARGQPVRFQRYDWSLDSYRNWVEVPAAEVLFVEGCGSGSRIVARFLTMLLWVEAPRKSALLAASSATVRPTVRCGSGGRARRTSCSPRSARERADYVIDAAGTASYDRTRHAVITD